MPLQSINSKKIIFVDIDNILWDFAGALYKKITQAGYAIPLPEHWSWYFFDKYFSKDEFYKFVSQVHEEQEQYKPFDDALYFLKELKRTGLYIVIASNRSITVKPATERWLVANHLDFDDLLITTDKTNYIDKTIEMVIDDSPIVLDNAVRKRVFATGLEYCWNRPLANKVPLWRSLEQIWQYVRLLYT